MRLILLLIPALTSFYCGMFILIEPRAFFEISLKSCKGEFIGGKHELSSPLT